jgi:Ion channel
MLAIELSFATLTVLGIMLVHLIGLAVLTRLLRSHSEVMREVRLLPLTLLLLAGVGIIAIHTIEIWIYAGIYLALGAFGSFEEALYFSTSTYSSIGYGDVLLPHDWRIFGAIEGPVGIIMLGWSTAFLVSLLARLKLLRHDWLRREGDEGGE